MGEMIKALLFVVVAEMGDKTQLLAMAMASKYKVKDVMLGVLYATILNHALAVAVGTYLSSVIPMDAVKLVAGISFLVFGLWTLRGDKIDEEDNKKAKFGPIMTVAIAFFIAEMGDKTQLMTVAIAAEGSKPLLTLVGTTAGMLVADSIGIIGGAWMCRHVPEKYIKWVAGLIFIFFGTLSLYNSVPSTIVNILTIVLYFAVIGVFIYLFGVKFTYNGQACELILAKEENAADLNEQK
jgi:putative Ca2+/H+ antiporter (TMEM165/GDT1 family)